VVVNNGSITVPTEEELMDTNTKIFPNPSSGIFTIISEFNDITNLEVRSLDGKLVHLISKLEGEVIDLSHLTPNSYIIKGITNDVPFTKLIFILK
jgi:hypothetical protein